MHPICGSRVTRDGCSRGYKLGEGGRVPKSLAKCNGGVCNVCGSDCGFRDPSKVMRTR
jgi:hypothetical protein